MEFDQIERVSHFTDENNPNAPVEDVAKAFEHWHQLIEGTVEIEKELQELLETPIAEWTPDTQTRLIELKRQRDLISAGEGLGVNRTAAS